jgi:hypothetical protein
MKIFTRTFVALFLLALTTIPVAMAQPGPSPKSSNVIARDIRNFEASLECDVPGVVEATLYNLVAYKALYPSADFSTCVREIEQLSKRSNGDAVSYKAYLALTFFRNSERMSLTIVSGEKAQQETFLQIADQLNSRLLATN